MLRALATSPGSARVVWTAAVLCFGWLAPPACAVLTPAEPTPTLSHRPILGLYGVPAGACSLAAATGFTVVQTYELEVGSFADSAAFVPRAHAYLEAASRHSLRVLLGVPRAWLHDRREADLRSVMRTLRTHPAVLAWYEDEIAAGGDLGSVEFLAALVHDEDPEHGLVIEEGNPDGRLISIGRVRMFTYYPVTTSARNAGRLKTLPERLPVETLRTPFWPVLQAFGRDLITGPAIHDLLAPRPEELQFSLCSAMVHGAEGIFFYPYMHATTYSVTKAASGHFAYGDYKPLPEIAPQLWRAVLDCTALAARLLLLTRDAPPAPEVKLVEAPADLEWRAWKTPRGVLAVIANPIFKLCRVHVQVPAEMTRAWILTPHGDDALLSNAHGVLELEVPGPGGLALRLEPPP